MMRLAPPNFLVMDSEHWKSLFGEPLWLSLFLFLPTDGENKFFSQVSINSKGNISYHIFTNVTPPFY